MKSIRSYVKNDELKAGYGGASPPDRPAPVLLPSYPSHLAQRLFVAATTAVRPLHLRNQVSRPL
jgi:hypothetical protein